MKQKLCLTTLVLLLFVALPSHAQQASNSFDQADSLKQEIRELQLDVQDIQLRLQESNKTLKQGVFVATLGYTVTIIGGQLLGTKPELGEALLYTGGAIGIGGTFVLVKGFNKLKKPK